MVSIARQNDWRRPFSPPDNTETYSHSTSHTFSPTAGLILGTFDFSPVGAVGADTAGPAQGKFMWGVGGCVVSGGWWRAPSKGHIAVCLLAGHGSG